MWAHRDIPIPFGLPAGAGLVAMAFARGGWSRPCRSPSRSRTWFADGHGPGGLDGRHRKRKEHGSQGCWPHWVVVIDAGRHIPFGDGCRWQPRSRRSRRVRPASSPGTVTRPGPHAGGHLCRSRCPQLSGGIVHPLVRRGVHTAEGRPDRRRKLHRVRHPAAGRVPALAPAGRPRAGDRLPRRAAG